MPLSEADKKKIDVIIETIKADLLKEDEIERIESIESLKELYKLLDKKGAKSYLAKKTDFLRLLLEDKSDEITEQGAVLLQNLHSSEKVKKKKRLDQYIPLLEAIARSGDKPSQKAANDALSKIRSASVLMVSTPLSKPAVPLPVPPKPAEKKSPGAAARGKAKVVKYMEELCALGESTEPVSAKQYEAVLELNTKYMYYNINRNNNKEHGGKVTPEDTCRFMLLRAFISCKARPEEKKTSGICRKALNKAAKTNVEINLDDLLESIKHTSDADKKLMQELWRLSKNQKRVADATAQSPRKKQVGASGAAYPIATKKDEVAVILSNLRSIDEAEIKAGLDALKQWAISLPKIKQLATNGIMDALLALLAQVPDSKHLVEILDCLINAFNLQPDNQAKITEAVIARLTILLQDKNSKIKKHAAWALGNAAFNDQRNQELIKANPVCIDELIKNLSHSEFEFGSEDLALYPAWALAASGACEDEGYQQAIADANGITHLQSYLAELSHAEGVEMDKKVVQDAIHALEACRSPKRVRVEEVPASMDAVGPSVVVPEKPDEVSAEPEPEPEAPVIISQSFLDRLSSHSVDEQAWLLTKMAKKLKEWYGLDKTKIGFNYEEIRVSVYTIIYMLMEYAFSKLGKSLGEMDQGLHEKNKGFLSKKGKGELPICPENLYLLDCALRALFISFDKDPLSLEKLYETAKLSTPRKIGVSRKSISIKAPTSVEKGELVSLTWDSLIRLGATKMGEVLNEIALQLKNWYEEHVGNQYLDRDPDFVELNYRLIEYAKKINPALSDSARMSLEYFDAEEAPSWHQPLHDLIVEKLKIINKRLLTFDQLLLWGNAYLARPIAPAPAVVEPNSAPAEKRSLPDSIEPLAPVATSEPLTFEVKAVVLPVPVQSPELPGDGYPSDIEEGEILEETRGAKILLARGSAAAVPLAQADPPVRPVAEVLSMREQIQLDEAALASQRMIKKVKVGDAEVACGVANAYPDGNCGFTATRLSLALQGKHLSESLDRMSFMALVERLYLKDDVDPLLKALIEKIFENDRAADLEDWKTKFSSAGYYMFDAHFNLVSRYFNIAFEYYVQQDGVFTIEPTYERIYHGDSEPPIATIRLAHVSTHCVDLNGNGGHHNHFDALVIDPTAQQIVQMDRLNVGESPIHVFSNGVDNAKVKAVSEDLDGDVAVDMSEAWNQFFTKPSKELSVILSKIQTEIADLNKQGSISEEQYKHALALMSELSRYLKRSPNYLEIFSNIKVILAEINNPLFTLEKLLEWGQRPSVSPVIVEVRSPAVIEQPVTPVRAASSIAAPEAHIPEPPAVEPLSGGETAEKTYKSVFFPSFASPDQLMARQPSELVGGASVGTGRSLSSEEQKYKRLRDMEFQQKLYELSLNEAEEEGNRTLVKEHRENLIKLNADIIKLREELERLSADKRESIGSRDADIDEELDPRTGKIKSPLGKEPLVSPVEDTGLNNNSWSDSALPASQPLFGLLFAPTPTSLRDKQPSCKSGESFDELIKKITRESSVDEMTALLKKANFQQVLTAAYSSSISDKEKEKLLRKVGEFLSILQEFDTTVDFKPDGQGRVTRRISGPNFKREKKVAKFFYFYGEVETVLCQLYLKAKESFKSDPATEAMLTERLQKTAKSAIYHFSIYSETCGHSASFEKGAFITKHNSFLQAMVGRVPSGSAPSVTDDATEVTGNSFVGSASQVPEI